VAFSRGAVFDYLQRLFQGSLQGRDSVLTVGTSMVQAADRDNERVALTLVNIGASTIFVGPTTQVSLTRGIRLGSNGGLITLSVDEDALLSALEWNAISDVAGGTLYIITVRRETREEGG